MAEGELIGSCLAPGLDRTVPVAALSDLREHLLYLHHAGRRYRFEPQANLNKLVADEALRQDPDDVLTNIRERLEKAIGTTKGVAIWPKEAGAIPDREPQFTVAYLHPDEQPERIEDTDVELLKGGRACERLQDALEGAPLTRARLTAPPPTNVVPATSFCLSPSAGNGWIVVGDAALAQDPLSGDGIVTALRSGWEGAATVLEGVNGHLEAWGNAHRRAEAELSRYRARRSAVYGSQPRWANELFWRARHGAAASNQ